MDYERLKKAGNLDIDPDKIMFLTDDEYNSMYDDDHEFKRLVELMEELEARLKDAVRNVQLDLKRIEEIADPHMRSEFINEELNYDKSILRKLETEYAECKKKIKSIVGKKNEDPSKGR